MKRRRKREGKADISIQEDENMEGGARNTHVGR